MRLQTVLQRCWVTEIASNSGDLILVNLQQFKQQSTVNWSEVQWCTHYSLSSEVARFVAYSTRTLNLDYISWRSRLFVIDAELERTVVRILFFEDYAYDVGPTYFIVFYSSDPAYVANAADVSKIQKKVFIAGKTWFLRYLLPQIIHIFRYYSFHIVGLLKYRKVSAWDTSCICWKIKTATITSQLVKTSRRFSCLQHDTVK